MEAKDIDAELDAAVHTTAADVGGIAVNPAVEEAIRAWCNEKVRSPWRGLPLLP